MGTPEWLKAKVRNYYVEMTQRSYLANWSGESLGFHFGLADESTASLSDSLLAMNAFVADKAGVRAGDRVLDAGCGVGGSSIWLAKERGADVTGISIEPGQIELATKFAAERGASARFAVMDMAATTFPRASFDVVWNIESLCHLADPRAYLAHVKELLLPGGRFACADLFLGAGGDPAQAKAMCDGWVLPSLRSAGEIAETLRELGFAGVTVIDLTPRVMMSAAALRAMAQRRMLVLRAEKTFAGKEDPVLEAHALGALGAVAGLESGSVTYHYLGAMAAAS
jgi:cyclopropane fatty-acyl-phospholipid synthase-like methyltransferase